MPNYRLICQAFGFWYTENVLCRIYKDDGQQDYTLHHRSRGIKYSRRAAGRKKTAALHQQPVARAFRPDLSWHSRFQPLKRSTTAALIGCILVGSCALVPARSLGRAIGSRRSSGREQEPCSTSFAPACLARASALPLLRSDFVKAAASLGSDFVTSFLKAVPPTQLSFFSSPLLDTRQRLSPLLNQPLLPARCFHLIFASAPPTTGI